MLTKKKLSFVCVYVYVYISTGEYLATDDDATHAPCAHTISVFVRCVLNLKIICTNTNTLGENIFFSVVYILIKFTEQS